MNILEDNLQDTIQIQNTLFTGEVTFNVNIKDRKISDMSANATATVSCFYICSNALRFRPVPTATKSFNL